jgi:hypothetical protein
MNAKQVKEILGRHNIDALNLLNRSAHASSPDAIAKQLLRDGFFGSIDMVIPYQEDGMWDAVQFPIDIGFDSDDERDETLKDFQLGLSKFIGEITPSYDEIRMLAVALGESLGRAERAESELSDVGRVLGELREVAANAIRERDKMRDALAKIVEVREKCNRYAMSDDWSQEAIAATVEFSIAIQSADELLHKRE